MPAYSAKRAVTDTKHFLTRAEASHVVAYGLHCSGATPPRVEMLRLAEPKACDPDGVGKAGHDVPGAPVHTRCVHSHQDLVVGDRRLGHLGKSEDVLGDGAVLVVNDRCHRLHSAERTRSDYPRTDS